MMHDWLAPALVAAVVSGLINVIGWFVADRIGIQRDHRLRDEKVHDVQIALRAEIMSDLLTMVVANRAQFLLDARERYARDPGYSIIVPHMARNLVFESLLGELQILPGEVIEPVIHYERMRETIERFVADLRGELFRQSPAERQLLMYSDYLHMVGRLEQLAHIAASALQISLNSPGVDRSSPESASATDAAAASRQDEP